ncbi:hypothetical protein PLICRDRAFT_42418 [Plicaturopsis crispa FD-325 SS-3]|nr:hypothetical protein PLICRDRAFT_42418 [Plicaturopsis crispa FD-325 SS-3]
MSTNGTHFYSNGAADSSDAVDAAVNDLEDTPDEASTSSESSSSELNGNSIDAKNAITDLVAQYGSSSSTAWLEFSRYHIWRPASPIPESSFLPAQGYMRRGKYIFAWGNPLVSDRAALEPTAAAFIAWAQGEGLRPIWCCVDHDLEVVLGSPKFQWSTVNCIYEDIVDPHTVLQLTSDKEKGSGGALVKDLKKNLRRAEKAHIVVAEVEKEGWSEEDKKVVEEGIEAWKKSRSGVQIASTSLMPWLDAEHRRYWLARKDGQIQGLLILTRIHGDSWQIKNCVSFPSAPKGTSEDLIYTALRDLHEEEVRGGLCGDPDKHVTATFGITASDEINPVENLSGWKVTWLSKTYSRIAKTAGLTRRGDFRSKFHSNHEPMYVCYPQDGFGLDTINALMKVLKK